MEDAFRSNDPQRIVEALLTSDVFNIQEESENLSSSGNSDIDAQKEAIVKLENIKQLLQKCVLQSAKSIANCNKAIAIWSSTAAGGGSTATIVIKDEASVDLTACPDDGALLVVAEAQFVEPRGRLKTTISLTGILIDGKAMTSFVPWSSIDNIVCVPSYLTTKKEGEDLLILNLGKAGILNGNKKIYNLVWNLNKNTNTVIEASFGQANFSGTESEVVNALITRLSGQKTVVPNPSLFQTITTSKPFLRCYKGIQEGALYFLKSGLLFVKPVLFIPVDAIASIGAGRGGNSGATRYVDLQVETIDDVRLEFTNIEREDLPAMQRYIKGYLEVRSQRKNDDEKKRFKAEKAVEGSGDKTVSGNNNDDDSDDDSDEDDEDFDPNEGDSDEDGDGSDNDESTASEHSSAGGSSTGSKRGRADVDRAVFAKEKKQKKKKNSDEETRVCEEDNVIELVA